MTLEDSGHRRRHFPQSRTHPTQSRHGRDLTQSSGALVYASLPSQAGSVRPVESGQLVFLDLRVQQPPVDAELFRSLAAIAPGLLQRGLDRLALRLRHDIF